MKNWNFYKCPCGWGLCMRCYKGSKYDRDNRKKNDNNNNKNNNNNCNRNTKGKTVKNTKDNAHCSNS